MRWKVVVASLALVFAMELGCKQQAFMTADDLNHYKAIGETPLECNAGPGVVPAVSHVKAPPTVLDAERTIRFLTLREALALALEQGTTGVQNAFFPGAITDLLASFNGPGNTNGSSISGSDNIRILALQPAIIGTNIESALSKFDARFIASSTWAVTDTPAATAIQTVQTELSSGVPVIAQDTASITTGMLKPLASGGVAGITFNTQYTLSNLHQTVNPAYQPSLTFQFEQPLLQGFGVEINQLRPTHPGSILTPYLNTARTEGILITRVRFDEQREEFERNVNFMLVNVEIAYWNLYGTYWTLYSREAALRQSYEAWKINKARFEAGRIPIQDLAQSRQQYESFRGQRLTALGDCLEKERQMRGFLALPMEDGTRLVPVDTPILSPYHPDWQSAANEALALRPELIMARDEVKVAQMNLALQKNSLMPDLRFVSQYGYNGVGSQLDGPAFAPPTVAGATNGTPLNAFRNLASGDYVNWTVGLQTTIPLGFRDANAATRAGRLNLAAAYQQLKDQERKALQILTFQYRAIFLNYEQIRIQRAQREAAAVQLDARFKLYIAGSKESTLDILLEAQRVWADALQAEYAAIVAYNSALANFEWCKGTIQRHSNVLISEGKLPPCAQVRAVEHERQRKLAIPLLQRPTPPLPQPGTFEAGDFIPKAPANEAASLPSLPLEDVLKEKPPLPEVAPGPRPISILPPASSMPATQPGTSYAPQAPPSDSAFSTGAGSALPPER